MEKPKHKILVVDDEGIIAMDLQLKLRNLGYDVPTIAHSAEQSIITVAQLRPDLVLMDINMGGAMDGIEAAQHIREKFGTPVIFLTAYTDHETIQRAKLAEPFGYIVKPFTGSELRITVEIALYKSEVARLLKRRAKQQEAIAEFGQRALAGMPWRVLMNDAVECIASTLNCECCGLFELLPDDNTFHLQAGVGWQHGLVGKATIKSGSDNSEVGYTLESHQLIIEDVPTETRFQSSRLLLDHGIISGICVVIHGLERPFGVLGAYSRSKQVFTQEDVNFLQPMANVLSQVNERNRAEEGLQRARDDIAERQRMEEERLELLRREQQARREAETANRAKDEFLAIVSHELRTPLNNIMGWVSLLGTGRLDEATAASAMKTIERSTLAQVQLIDDILDVSRIITGKMVTEFAPVNLPDVIAAAVEIVRPTADAKDITLKLVIEPGAEEVWGDANRLQQIIWNLLSNAIKFTPRNGLVEVCLKRNDSMAQITVRDNGLGIGAEFLPHVFDRFSQADSSSARLFGGLGLGLAIVRHLVEIHGGTVTVNSEGAHKGATFTVQVPLLEARRRSELEAQDERNAISNQGISATGINNTLQNTMCSSVLQGLRVLVVDDEPDTAQLVAKMLELAGAQVQAVTSVDEVLETLQEYWPDVLISDIAMPGDDGYSLIRQVRRLESVREIPLPAIALTAHARPEDRKLALSAGFQCHLVKPVLPDALVDTVAELTGRDNSVK